MVAALLGVGDQIALADDAADALAIALCHLYLRAVLTRGRRQGSSARRKLDRRMRTGRT